MLDRLAWLRKKWQSRKIVTIGKFLRDILHETDIAEADVWLGKFIGQYNEDGKSGPESRWNTYCQMALTVDAIKHLSYIFSSQISFSMTFLHERVTEDVQQKGLQFLGEIYQKARDLGFDVKRDEIVWILNPKKPKEKAKSAKA